MKNVIKIVFVIIATLVGAGFASGKEIFSFFFIYGKEGIIGIFISSIIISLVIYKTFKVCAENEINTYQEFCNYIGNFKNSRKFKYANDSKILKVKFEETKFSSLLNNIVNIFLLITFYIMISGFSSFLKQEFNINEIIGSMLIIGLCYLIFLNNIKGLIQVSNYLIPVLIAFLICISVKNINVIQNYNNIFSMVDIQKNRGIIKSILYACYNCLILIPVLVPLRNLIKNNKRIILISIISCILIIVLSFAIYNLLLQGNKQIFYLEMPIIEIVKKYGDFYKYSYIIMIGISIFTTAISAGCGFLNNSSKNEKRFKKNLVIVCFFGIFLSQISFSVLVNLLYPILGVIGIFEVILLFFTRRPCKK